MTTQTQVLADYVNVITHFKKEHDAENCPVIAFGGSYGGTLTTFLRTAYPSAVVGGLASSAPIGYYDVAGWAAHGVDEYTWSDIVTRDYTDADPMCMDAILAANDVINAQSEDVLLASFHVCSLSDMGPM